MKETKDERLALLCAMDKRIAPALKEAKAEARAEMLELAEAFGTDRKAIKVGGTKVGEIGLSYGKAHPFVYNGCEEEALKQLEALDLVEVVPAKGWEEHFELVGDSVVCKDTGEVVKWCGWQPEVVKTATVRGCKPEDVLAALGGRIEAVDVAGLLEGGF